MVKEEEAEKERRRNKMGEGRRKRGEGERRKTITKKGRNERGRRVGRKEKRGDKKEYPGDCIQFQLQRAQRGCHM